MEKKKKKTTQGHYLQSSAPQGANAFTAHPLKAPSMRTKKPNPTAQHPDHKTRDRRPRPSSQVEECKKASKLSKRTKANGPYPHPRTPWPNTHVATKSGPGGKTRSGRKKKTSNALRPPDTQIPKLAGPESGYENREMYHPGSPPKKPHNDLGLPDEPSGKTQSSVYGRGLAKRRRRTKNYSTQSPNHRHSEEGKAPELNREINQIENQQHRKKKNNTLHPLGAERGKNPRAKRLPPQSPYTQPTCGDGLTSA